jgi:DNA-nicking Smr family endonuclease
VLAEAMQGVDPATLLRTDDALGFRRPEVGEEVLVRLRSGHWAIQGEIDLHGLRRDEAREQLAGFLRLAQRRGQRCLRVVHGKGNGSPGREPVLKGKVQRWLSQHAAVLAFAQAGANDGGAGALIVLLGDAAAP